MNIPQLTTNLEQFRSTLYQNLANRADPLMELVDAISSTPLIDSVVAYSLSGVFRRSDTMVVPEMVLAHLVVPYLPRPDRWLFWLLLVDGPPQPRPYAHTLADREMVYQPEVVKSKSQ